MWIACQESALSMKRSSRVLRFLKSSKIWNGVCLLGELFPPHKTSRTHPDPRCYYISKHGVVLYFCDWDGRGYLWTAWLPGRLWKHFCHANARFIYTICTIYWAAMLRYLHCWHYLAALFSHTIRTIWETQPDQKSANGKSVTRMYLICAEHHLLWVTCE